MIIPFRKVLETSNAVLPRREEDCVQEYHLSTNDEAFRIQLFFSLLNLMRSNRDVKEFLVSWQRVNYDKRRRE